MQTPLKVAVVGPRGWGAEHTRVFSGRPDTDLVAVVGRDPERTAMAASPLGARPYTDIGEMVEREGPDLITTALPNEGHFAPTMELLDYGIPLLVEKPLVFDVDEADAIVAKAQEHGTFIAIDFNHRYAEPVIRTKNAIDDGSIGEPVFTTWRFGGEPNLGHSPHKNIIETQCHAFDMLEYLLGPISSVSAQMTKKTYGAWSTIALALEFANGTVGTLLGSYDSSYAYRDTHLLEINGTQGRAVVHDTVRSFELARAGDETAQVWQAGYFNDEARNFHGTFDRYVEDMLRALRTGQRPPVPVEAGRRALQIAVCAIQAHETGQRVEVPAP